MKPKREKYNSGIGIIHKLRINEVSKKGFFTLQESFIINLNLALLKWFDFMGLQRHIKVLGIFSRLYLRDGKDGYLKDIPLTLKYTLDAANRYEETRELAKLLQELQ